MTQRESIIILMADDDEDDVRLTQDAMKEARLTNDFRVVPDGQALMDYLKHEGTYTDVISAPRPSLILLDLNMPKKDGRQALKEIKSDPTLKNIPVVILTTSDAPMDINQAYEIGANSYLVKPVTFTGLVELMTRLNKFWLELVELPTKLELP